MVTRNVALAIFAIAILIIITIVVITTIASKDYNSIVVRRLGQGNSLPPKTIDAVVTWVDSSDPQWQTVKNKYTNDVFDTKDRWNDQTKPDREVSICLRLILQNMPWIRHIHLLTYRPQYPRCLVDDKILHRAVSENKIVLVHHDEFFTELDHLPSFNSLSIECNLHTIPNLAEHFVYFNDDMFVSNPIPASVLFDGDKPVVYGSRFLHIRQPVMCRPDDGHSCCYTRTLNLLGEQQSTFFKFRHCHQFKAFRKSHYAKLMEQNWDKFGVVSASRQRTPEGYIPNLFVHNKGLVSGDILLGDNADFKHLYWESGKRKRNWTGDEYAICINNCNGGKVCEHMFMSLEHAFLKN